MKTKNTGSQSSVWDVEAKEYEIARKTDPVYSSCILHVNKAMPNDIQLCLDAGCGIGMATIGFASRADGVVAVDYSLKSLKLLQSKGIPNVYLVQADIAALPFVDSVFNFSACVNTLQHLKPGRTQKKTIGELRRVTEAKRSILVSVHHYSKGKKQAGWIKEGKPGQAGIDYIFRFDRSDLWALMPNATIVAVGYYGLCKIRFFGCRIQNIVATIFGRLAAAFGNGHMLVGVELNEKDP